MKLVCVKSQYVKNPDSKLRKTENGFIKKIQRIVPVSSLSLKIILFQMIRYNF